MKKMLAKAVVLGLVLGGIGFVANDAQAATIGTGVGVYSGAGTDITGRDVKTTKKLPDNTVLAEQKDLEAVNKEAADAKTAADAAQKTANAAKDAAVTNAEAIKTKADAWDTAKKFAAVQEMFDDQTRKNAELDKKNENQDKAIKANGEAIKANGEAINTERDWRVAMDNALDKKSLMKQPTVLTKTNASKLNLMAKYPVWMAESIN